MTTKPVVLHEQKPDLKDGGDKQPVPLQVLFVVENLTVSQVHHQCFLCVLNTNTEDKLIIRVSFQSPVQSVQFTATSTRSF